jgi:succinate dehydrogenase flavin-adding protein (antitoxin of CptAB toxin-antitoxin module)
MKELDVLLERYVRSRLSEASSEERQVLARLLELPDPVLSDYLFGHAAAPEPHMADLVAAIRLSAPWQPIAPTWEAATPAWEPAGAASMGEYRVSYLNFNGASGSIQVAARRPLSPRE